LKIALTNVPAGSAVEISRTLVEERFAACINRFPMQSTYRWQGKVEEDDEVALLIKVAADRVDALRERLGELHPYELMEFVVLDIDAAKSLRDYIEFVREGCKTEEEYPGKGSEVTGDRTGH